MNCSAHYISGTHWDREWHRPCQEYRVLLVKLIDELLELMETNPAFRFFQLDGQTCVLDDHLEIRPENRARLATLIRERRILIGPWFTRPELFCVGDEALVRNLALGRRLCHEWETDPMPVGFICDMVGQPSQMPQVFAGFGYHAVVLGRGTNEHTTPMFFDWQEPDGSRAFTYKLQDRQGSGAFALPRAIQLDERTASWQEADIAEKPFLGLQAVGHGRRGLAFLAAGGLREGGVIDDQRRTLQVTLLRSFRKTVGTGGESDGMEQGRLVWRYALLPFAGQLPRAAALRKLARLRTGIATRQAGARPSGFPPLTGTAPATRGFIELKHGRLVISAIKPPEQGAGIVLRLWNPTNRTQTDTLKFWRAPKRATHTNLDETPRKGPAPKRTGANVTVAAAPRAIVTVRLEW